MKHLAYLMYLSSLVLLLFTSCTKEHEINNLSGGRIKALGHAGMGINSTYPKNTFESIMQCISVGMDGTELDVQLTKDNVLVAFHDEKLDSKTNLKGYVRDYTWNELKSAYYTNLPYLNYRIISLDELHQNLPNSNFHTYVYDCKLFNPPTQMYYKYISDYIQAMEEFILKHALINNVYVESDAFDFLRIFKSKQPEFKFLSVSSDFSIALNKAIELDLDGISMNLENFTSDMVRDAHKNKKIFCALNVQTHSDNVSAIRRNVDIIQTDSPRSLARLLDL